MGDTGIAQRTHYDTLGIAPDAGRAAIAEAFARELRRPHRFGDIAAISTAFETLRDPIRREAYDASIGLNRTPRPTPPSGTIRAAFLCPASADPIEKGALGSVQLTEVRAAPQPEPLPKAPEATRLGNWTPEAEPVPLTAVWNEDDAQPELARVEDRVAGAPETPDWRRTGLALGGLVAGVILVGAWAGWESGNDTAQAQATIPLAPAKPPGAAPAATEEPAADVRADQPKRLALTTPQEQGRKPVAAPKARAADSLAPLPEPVTADVPTVEPGDASTAASPAGMPLSNRVVARTLDRIGYACGDIAASAAVDSSAGVYRVTCSSGQSYLATPVKGRYRFRRAGD